ncbi:MAG: transporter substrate-binding domain-containing protein [Oligoflexus sp.]
MKNPIKLFILSLLSLLINTHILASSLKEIKKRGHLTVACEPGFLPFEMLTQKGEFVGFDIEMMRAFAKDIGVEAKFISTKWDGIIPGLMAKKYDVIVSGMTITPERARAVLFSEPYYNAGLKIMIKKDLIGKIKSLQELDDPKYTVAVKLGTTGDIFVQKNVKKARIRKLDTEADAAQSVILGRVDAFIYDKPYLEIYSASKKSQVGLLDEVLSKEQFGLAARKQDQELITAFNAFLKRWKADKKNGYDHVYRQVFDEMTWKEHFPQMF